MLCEASTTCRDGIGGVEYQIVSKGCDGEAPNFFSVPRQMILESNGDSMCARVFRRLNGLCIKF